MGAGFWIGFGIILTLAFLIGIPLLVIRAILGGRKGPGEPSVRRGKVGNFLGGFPTRFYTMDRKAGSFSIDPDLYNFKTPRVTPNLDTLRKASPTLDLKLARKLHLGPDVTKDNPATTLDMERAKDLFLMGAETMLDFVYDENGDEEVEGEIT